MRETLKRLIIKHEGIRLKPYIDTTGHITIGIGRNLTDNGISYDEALYLLRNDLTRAIDELSHFEWYSTLDINRAIALVDMNFNLGLSRFLTFKKMIEALKQHDYETAAREMLDSRWAKQVGKRAEELAEILKTGKLHL